jgi:3-isopropylmalate/(R)-2-methylmalate dehydratase small subunit
VPLARGLGRARLRQVAAPPRRGRIVARAVRPCGTQTILEREAPNVKFTGTAHRYGRDIDTDVIIPARYLNTSDPEELAKHCLEDLDAGFVAKVATGDILVAEENFGCGSSREHAPISIKAAGVSVVIAKSFARIFYRNAINTGLPIMEAPDAVDGISAGDSVEVDADTGEIRNLTTGAVFHAQPFPPFVKDIIESGGLVESTKRKLAG